MCSPALAAEQADGELFGAALVMGAIALALTAWHSASPARLSAVAAAAGAAAVAAPMVKQSLLEGLLLLAGLALHGWWGRGGDRRRAVLLARGALLGALVPCALFWLWLAATRIGPADAWHDIVGSRGAAFEVLWSTSPDDSVRRAGLLLVLGSITGLLPVVATWLLAGRRDLRPATAEVGLVTLLLVYGIVGIASGGAYWPPYLLQLAPAAVLAAGALAPSVSGPGAWMRGCSRLVAAAALVGTLVSGVVYATDPSAWSSQRIGEWLAGSKEASDTGFVAYGLPSVLETADMPSSYPHLWSAAMRTLDPGQDRLRGTLAGPDAPSWIVQVNGLDAWGIDEGSRLRDLLRERYRVVAEICGRPVWLRADLTRELAPPPTC
jgi:hypothetical protein